MSRTNYIFVDYENVQETDLNRIANKPVRVILVLGERHKNLPIPLVKLIQKYPDQVCLTETVLNGKNALDFVLACEVGAASEKDPGGYFHIVSRDKGFDALVKHLKSKGVLCARHETFTDVPLLTNAVNPDERVKRVAAHIQANQASRPKRRKTLVSQIQALFGKTLQPDEVDLTIQGLVAQKILTLSSKDEVAYGTPVRAAIKKSLPLPARVELDASLPAIIDRAFKKP